MIKNFLKIVKGEFFYMVKSIQRFFSKVSAGTWRNVILLCIVFIAIFSGVFLLWAASLKTPDINSFDTRLVGDSTKIYDRTGTILLYNVDNSVRRTVVPFDQISPNVKNATVAIEDEGFYTHSAISITSIIRAFLVDITHFGFIQGGSTITQQVVKNSLLSNDKTLTRKAEEWVLAIKLEREASKDTILNLYLNENPYGGNIYGVEEASEAYFGVHANDLTIPEAAYIAAMTQAPSYYSPYGPNKDALVDRKNIVLKDMKKDGYITEAQYEDALAHDAVFLPQIVNSIKAPHFVMFVINYLDQKYGSDMVQNGGLKVVTTLDYDIQQKAETIVTNYVNANQTKFNADNAAMVASDPKSGQILMMVGSRDFFSTTTDGQFNAATAHRQPGSSFKPFVYVTAFNKGYTPDTILFDVNTEFSTDCTPQSTPKTPGAVCYDPVNYEGAYDGPMTARAALAQSRNIPAVQMIYLAGVADSIATAHAMGIQSLNDDPSHYGLPLVLGGGEVSPLDMSEAYGVFANDGVKNPATAILEVDDKDGNVLEKFATSSEQVLPAQSARDINSILSDNSARAPIFGSHYLPGYNVGIKTGTTNDWRDAWIIGYTPNISVSAWMGNNDDSSMNHVASATIVAPMWKLFMQAILPTRPVESFVDPEPTATDTKPILRGVWQNPEGTGTHTILYYVNKDDPTGPDPTDPTSDPEYVNWEYGVQTWLAGQGISSAGSSSTIPTIGTTSSSSNISIQITNPLPTGAYEKNENVGISVNIRSVNPISTVDYYLNGQFIGESNSAPFNLSFVPSSLGNLLTSSNTLEAVAYDSSSSSATAQSILLINNQ